MVRHPRVVLALVTAAFLGIPGLGLAVAPAATPSCATGPAAGGDWPAYGGDPADSHTQPAETTLSPADVSGLTPAWVFSAVAHGGDGVVNGPPVEAHGCTVVGTSTGWVYALRSDTGQVVWSRHIVVGSRGLGGTVVGSAAISGQNVYVIVNASGDGNGSGPYVAKLGLADGALEWNSPPLATAVGDYSNASPVVLTTDAGEDDAVVFAGFSPPEGDSTGQGGFALISADSGRLLARTFTIPPADQAKGYAGGGIWSTPAYDPRTGFAYVGGGNPDSKQLEHPNTDAVLKIDLRQDSATFGQIVGRYNGNVDQYTAALQTLAGSPACAATDGAPAPLDDPVCGQLDMDFGASPNLFTVGGVRYVGDLQKSGVYHVARADDMTPAWTALVGAPCQACNAGSTAVDGQHIVGVSSPGGAAFGLPAGCGASTCSPSWVAPVGDGVHFETTSEAGGVVFTIDNLGFFDAFDASTGAVLLRRPLSRDTTTTMVAYESAGVSIARHTVYVAASGGPGDGLELGATESSSIPSPPPGTADTFVIAYRLPA